MLTDKHYETLVDLLINLSDQIDEQARTSPYPEPPDPREFIDEDTGRINTVLYTATLVAWERVVMEIVKSQRREPIRLDEDDLDGVEW